MRSQRQQARILARREANRISETEIGDLIENRGDWLFAHLPRESAQYIYDLHSKDKQKVLAQQANISVAEEYLEGASLSETLDSLAWLDLERFVLKPNHGRNSVAVFCLVREGDRYRDINTGVVHSLTQLKRAADREYGPLKRKDEWLVEELLMSRSEPDRPAVDYKFYCFGDRAELVRQRVSIGLGKERKVVMRHYDRDGEPVDPGLRANQVSDDLVLPDSFATMLAEAERVSGMITTPFMRVDLYDTTRGVVLGELTPGPGGMYTFNEAWKRRFTRRWFESATALEAALETGEKDPLMPPAAAGSGELQRTPELVSAGR